MKTQLLKPMCALLLTCLMSHQALAALVNMTIKDNSIKINTAKDGSGTSITVNAGTKVQLVGKSGSTGTIMVDGILYYIPMTSLQASQTETPAAADVQPAAQQAVAARAMVIGFGRENINLRTSKETSSKANIAKVVQAGESLEAFETDANGWTRVRLKGSTQDLFTKEDFLQKPDAYATAKAEEPRCVRSLNPDGVDKAGKQTLKDMAAYLGIKNSAQLVNTQWAAQNPSEAVGTVFNLTDTGTKFKVAIADMPRHNWDALVDANRIDPSTGSPRDPTGLFIGGAIKDIVLGLRFGGKMCIKGSGSKATLTVRLDGTSFLTDGKNSKGQDIKVSNNVSGGSITIKPTGRGTFIVNGELADQAIDNAEFSITGR